MIEINLLPDNVRQTEGTPPRRFGLYLVWLVVALLLGVYTVKFYRVTIPDMNNQIAINTKIKDDKTKEKKEVDAIKAEIGRVNEKVNTLKNLSNARVRWGRILDQICNSVPDGVWFKQITVMPEPGQSKYPTTAPGGKMYKISLPGYVTGISALDNDSKLSQLMANMRQRFNIVNETPSDPKVPDNYGFSPFLGLRFHDPKPSNMRVEKFPPLAPKWLEVVKPEQQPKEGLSFMLTMVFELKPPAK